MYSRLVSVWHVPGNEILGQLFPLVTLFLLLFVFLAIGIQ